MLLLLHGSPGSSLDFARLAPELARDFVVLAPDLPGFGGSEREVPDYSIAAHAVYVRQLLEQLSLARVHVLGFSMGGGVALELAGQAPSRVRSLTLLSSIGVEELELLGSHAINHGIHGLQLGGLWLLLHGTPHFGVLDGGMLSLEYARNFYDSDQRPLRGILERLEIPTFILHGRGDWLVPVEAALEHRRIVPQSELVLLDDSHFMVFAGGERLREPLANFIARVERGEAADRGHATTDRRAAARLPFDRTVVPKAAGPALLVLMGLLVVGTLVSEDLSCIAAGLLVAQGRLGFLAATAACFWGILLGDLGLYWVGRALGRPWLQRAPLKWWIRPEAVEAGARWFRQRGPAIVFISRFTPGTRLATYVAAGLLRAGFWRFAALFALASAIWTPVLVGLAAWVGASALDRLSQVTSYAYLSVALLALGLYLVWKLAIPMFTWRGRRRLYGRVQRMLRWEFWPPWMFYPPVVAYVLWLALKHRGLTLFTASNPGIPASGFIGESKGEILDQLEPSLVARYLRLAPEQSLEERLEAARSFLAEHGLSLPVVVKPDAGQRGLGVTIARSGPELETALAEMPDGVVLQEYVGGFEYGVFYTRLPGEERGRVFSITQKILPFLVGDGRRSVADLILADDRAVCAEQTYLERLRERALQVPAAGERVGLTDLGTHCRGAIFLDGAHLKTPELEEAIDRLSSSFDGFYFGRYDLRVPTPEHLSRGEGLRVLELNGVTSEATHIYDPKHGVFTAYRVLFEQWRLAFEIGRLNRDRGVEPESAFSLGKRLMRFHRRQSRGLS